MPKLRTNLIIYDAKPYFLHPNPDNLSFPENFFKSNNTLLPYELNRICDGRFNRVVLAETRPTSTKETTSAEEKIAEDKKAAEETQFILPVMQLAFQHKFGKNVEVLFDPLWHDLSEAADKVIKTTAEAFANQKIAAAAKEAKSENPLFDVKSFLETVEKYNINDIVALAHRTAAAYPLDTINLHIFNTRYKSENARSENQLILDFFKQHNLLPNNVYSIELVGPKDELGQDFCSAVSVEPFVGKLAPLKMFAPEVKLTTAAEWQEHKKIPAADILFGASLTNEYLPAEIKFPVPPPAVQQLTKPVATVTPIATVAQVTPAVASVQTAVPSSTRSTITFAQMTAQRVGLLDGYKSGEISIARYMSANNLKTDTHVFSNKNILDMLIAISKWDKWVEKGKGNANPLMFGKPHTPDSIRKMRNGVYNDLVTLRKEIQAKLDDTFGTFRRSRTTQAFYELIAAMPKFENNDVRDMGIRAFCLRYDIDYETIAKQADAPILDGVEADAMNAVYRKT